MSKDEGMEELTTQPQRTLQYRPAVPFQTLFEGLQVQQAEIGDETAKLVREYSNPKQFCELQSEEVRNYQTSKHRVDHQL